MTREERFEKYVSERIQNWILFGHISKSGHLNETREALNRRMQWNDRLTYASTIVIPFMNIKALCEHISNNIRYETMVSWFVNTNKPALCFNIPLLQEAEYIRINSSLEDVPVTALRVCFGRTDNGKGIVLYDMYPV